MRRLSLGRTTDVSLEQARERANALTSAARSGRDLIGEQEDAREAAASRISVEKLIDLYVRRRVSGRLRTAKAIPDAALPERRSEPRQSEMWPLTVIVGHFSEYGLV